MGERLADDIIGNAEENENKIGEGETEQEQ